MNKIVKLVLFLGIVSAVSGLLLGFVNDLTAPIIEKNANAAEYATLEVMYPGAEYEKLDITNDVIGDASFFFIRELNLFFAALRSSTLNILALSLLLAIFLASNFALSIANTRSLKKEISLVDALTNPNKPFLSLTLDVRREIKSIESTGYIFALTPTTPVV